MSHQQSDRVTPVASLNGPMIQQNSDCILVAIATAIITNPEPGTFPDNTRWRVTVELTIRRATVMDVACIAYVPARTWRSTCRRLIPEEALAAMTHEGRPSMQERLQAEIPDGHGVLVTEADGTLVGFSNLTVTRDAANDGQAFELCTICVHPTPQGCGAGSTLRLASEAAMRDAGATIAELWVLDGHERAQRFYWKHRRERDGATRDDVLFRCTRPGGPLSQAAPKRRQRVTARASPSRRASAARISGVSPSCVRDELSVEGRPAKYRRWRSRPGRTQTGARSGHRHQVYRHG